MDQPYLRSALACAVLLTLQTSVLAGADRFPRLRNQIDSRVPQKPASQGKSANGEASFLVQKVPLPAPYLGGVAVDINNRQTVGGVYFTPEGADITFTWRSGEEPVLISHPGSQITSVPSIADSGVLFGNWGSFTQQTAGFYYPETNTWKELPPYPGKQLNIGQRANNSGRATGYACNGSWFQYEDCVFWIWNGKSYELPQLPAAIFSQLEGINEVGKTVGRSLISPPFDYRSFVLDGNKVSVLLPDTKSSAFDLNNREDVVLTVEVDPTMLFQPAVLRDGKLTFLPLYPAAVGTSFIGLNDRGDFSGLAYDSFDGPQFVYPIVALKR